ncbi:MAG: AgmX/PglI C-terminal domain-containing protein [Deltaproteobacteria bacterium]|nr:AgmX/PglI C-terminal domain-containing protein [Deltaproteobacteria bacterium]
MGGTIAVYHQHKLAILGVGYAPDHAYGNPDVEESWTELHVGADGVRVVTAPELAPVVIAWKNGALDREGLRAAYAKLRWTKSMDVLAGAGASTQQLLDVVIALDDAGAKALAIGELRGSSEQRITSLKQARELAFPPVTAGTPNKQGDLDKAVIKKSIKQSLDAITHCYEKELLAKPTLAGTIMVQFFISPNGKVASSSASGVDPAVASCVAAVIKKIEFPKPKGGGGVQVNYPFTFRPAFAP